MGRVAKKTCLRDPTHLYYLCSEDIGADQLRSYMYRASDRNLNLNLNSLLVKRQIDNPSPGAMTGGN